MPTARQPEPGHMPSQPEQSHCAGGFTGQVPHKANTLVLKGTAPLPQDALHPAGTCTSGTITCVSGMSGTDTGVGFQGMCVPHPCPGCRVAEDPQTGSSEMGTGRVHHQPGLLMRTHSLWQSPLHRNHERTPQISDALVSSPHSPLPSMHLLPSHHTGRNPASANSASRAEDQCPLPSAHHHGRAPAHQHDTSHFKSGPAPGLKPMIPNLSISSPSPAHGSPAHGCHCFLRQFCNSNPRCLLTCPRLDLPGQELSASSLLKRKGKETLWSLNSILLGC